MKKGILVIVLLLMSCFSFLGTAAAAPVTEWAGAWVDHRSYDQTFFTGNPDTYSTHVWWELSGIDTANVTGVSVTLHSTTVGLTEDTTWSPSLDRREFGTRLSETKIALAYNQMLWETTYDLNILTDQGNLSHQFVMNQGDMPIMDVPVTQVVGNSISWGAVNLAEYYRIRILDENTWDMLYQFTATASETNFDLSGYVPNGNYILRMEARKDGFAGGMSARGTYYTKIEVVPVPGAIWLLASGLLGVVGYKRRQDK